MGKIVLFLAGCTVGIAGTLLVTKFKETLAEVESLDDVEEIADLDNETQSSKEEES